MFSVLYSFGVVSLCLEEGRDDEGEECSQFVVPIWPATSLLQQTFTFTQRSSK